MMLWGEKRQAALFLLAGRPWHQCDNLTKFHPLGVSALAEAPDATGAVMLRL